MFTVQLETLASCPAEYAALQQFNASPQPRDGLRPNLALTGCLFVLSATKSSNVSNKQLVTYRLKYLIPVPISTCYVSSKIKILSVLCRLQRGFDRFLIIKNSHPID